MPLVGLMIFDTPKLALVVPFVLAEVIDRFEYYSNLHIDSPAYLLNK
jgi:hypothetical protein